MKIGDRVSIIDQSLKGEIISIDQDQVKVRIEGGLDCVFFTNELIVLPKEGGFLSYQIKNESSFIKQKNIQSNKKKHFFKKNKNELVMEVDLHIEKLVKSFRGLDNYDILNKQIEHAKFKIEYCISKKISKIIFIHGVGEGVLKSELSFLLDRYPVKYYDASYKTYGNGATEVYIYQNVN